MGERKIHIRIRSFKMKQHTKLFTVHFFCGGGDRDDNQLKCYVFEKYVDLCFLNISGRNEEGFQQTVSHLHPHHHLNLLTVKVILMLIVEERGIQDQEIEVRGI